MLVGRDVFLEISHIKSFLWIFHARSPETILSRLGHKNILIYMNLGQVVWIYLFIFFC